jgi:putative SOS response-associated peptidase YedK
MCGKFTAMKSWAEVVAFSQPLTADRYERSNDAETTYKTFGTLPVIVWDKEVGKRKIVQMRWGLPEPNNWKKPKHFHARAETIDTKAAWAEMFADGRRGIVLMKTFNETPPDTNDQWTIDPRDGRARGIAFLGQGYEIEGSSEQLLACSMVTVPSNKLLRETIHENDPDPRMPAILRDEDWAIWLGEKDAPLDQIKSVLRTTEGGGWTIAPEPKAEKPTKTKTPPKSKKVEREPEPGLF